MTGTVASFLARLDGRFPLEKAAAWDRVGLQVGDREAPATSVAVCHDVTGEVVDAVTRAPVDIVVAYHPLLFTDAASLVAGPGPAGRAYRIARIGSSLVVVHTAFDVAAGGAADCLASTIGLEQVRGFGPSWGAGADRFVVYVPSADADHVAAAMTRAGGGRIGNYDGCHFRVEGLGSFGPREGAAPVAGSVGRPSTVEEVRLEMISPRSRRDAVAAAIGEVHPYEEPAFDVFEAISSPGLAGRAGALSEPMALSELADDVAQRLGSYVRIGGDPTAVVGRVAVVPGSGSSMIEEAARVADVLVTGDVSHHRAREALDRGLFVLDAGHVPTERPGVRALYAAVAEIVPDATDLTDLDPHPWREPR